MNQMPPLRTIEFRLLSPIRPSQTPAMPAHEVPAPRERGVVEADLAAQGKTTIVALVTPTARTGFLAIVTRLQDLVAFIAVLIPRHHGTNTNLIIIMVPLRD